jgi:hypothetical protein
MIRMRNILGILLALSLVFGLSVTVCAATFTDAHGNVIELDDTLEAYASVKLYGADDAARKGETNLGDLWADALRWFAASGKINEYFEEDDLTAGNTEIVVEPDYIVALWNGGNIRDDIEIGKFGAVELAEVLPYPNKVAVVYMTGAQLLETLEAAAQGLPYTDETASACASFMQVSGLSYTLDLSKAYDKGEAYGEHWFRANSVNRASITEVNGNEFDAEATYAVIVSNANFNGMDSSYLLKEAAAENDKSTITTAVVRDAVWMYIDEELDNAVGDEYADARGRITLITDDAADKPGTEETESVVSDDVQDSESEQSEIIDETPDAEQEQPDTDEDISAAEDVTPDIPEEDAETEPEPSAVPDNEPVAEEELSANTADEEYIVRRGDCLWTISFKFYGRGSLWGKIFEANPQIKNANFLYIGQVLIIPAP